MERLAEHEAKAIRHYVDSQTRDADDLATTVQRVGRRRVAGQDYEFFDVRTTSGSRWWVITNATNLYDQEAFPTVDQAFSLHLGLMQQIMDRGRREGMEDADEVSPAWRRLQQAMDAMDSAKEAEDYQSVGIKCREALIALGRQYVDADWMHEQATPPKASDAKAWLALYAEALIPSRRPRAYLKSLSEKAWDLAVWLQHYTDARDWDAELVLDATASVINTLTLAIIRHEEPAPRRCPQCDSYRLTVDGDIAERQGQEGWWQQDVCSACEWRGEEVFNPWDEETVRRIAARLEEEPRAIEAGEQHSEP